MRYHGIKSFRASLILNNLATMCLSVSGGYGVFSVWILRFDTAGSGICKEKFYNPPWWVIEFMQGNWEYCLSFDKGYGVFSVWILRFDTAGSGICKEKFYNPPWWVIEFMQGNWEYCLSFDKINSVCTNRS